MLEFLSLKQQAFGLDISDLSLKIVKLKRRGQFFDLASFGEAQIKPGIVKKGEIRDQDKLAEIIKKTMREVKGEKLGTRNAIVSLSEEKAFLQVIQMPWLSEEDLKSAVIFEAENHIPLPIEEVYLDYQVVPPLYNHLDHLDVLIAAFPQKIVDSYLTCLKKANIKPIVLEVESLAISRALIKDETTTQPVLLIDFGANRSVFIIFSGHSVRFTFSIPVSPQSFTEALSQAMKIDLIKAEKLKIKYGLEGRSTKTGQEVFESLIPALTDLIEQIKKYLDYYQTHVSHEHLPPNGKGIERILICGDGARLKGLADFLSSQLKIPVEIGNPWVNLISESKKEALGLSFEKSLSCATAIGLALRGISV